MSPNLVKDGGYLARFDQKRVPEGIPVSLMEAMSYEIPVIATDCGGTKELVDGKSGILVNQNDPKAIANAIFKLINNNEFRRKLSKNGTIERVKVKPKATKKA